MVRRPVGLIEPVNGNRDGASQTALVALGASTACACGCADVEVEEVDENVLPWARNLRRGLSEIKDEA